MKNIPQQAIIILRYFGKMPAVAGLTTAQRWERMLLQAGVESIKTVNYADLPRLLEAMSSTVIIAVGDYAIDLLSLEHFIDTVGQGQHADLYIMKSEKGDLAPVVAVRASILGESEAEEIVQLFDSTQKEEILKTIQAKFAVKGTTRKKAFWQQVTTDQDARRAEWGMLKVLQHRPGGLVAKYINRPLSLPVSRLLVNTWVSPNMTTVAAFILGAIGVAFVFAGGWLNTVIGAVLLQLNSIIDGIDGELARIRLTQSALGAYLDSVCDEILNSALFIAMGYNLGVRYGNDLYFAAGVFAGFVALVYALIHWHCKYRHGLGFYWWFEAYKPRKQVQQSTTPFAYFKKLFWKESYLLLLLIFALLDQIWLLLVGSVVSALVIVVLFIIHVGIKRARW